MNEAFDPLEAELSALRPIVPADDLRVRIGKELGESWLKPAQDSMGGWRIARRFRLIAVVACMAAICLVIVVWRWPASQPSLQVVHPEVPSSPGSANQPTALPHSSWESDVADGPFSWPLQETSPLKAYTSIPADLLE